MAKKGRPKAIETPELFYKVFQDYKKFVKDNPRIVFDYVGRDGDKVEKPLEAPLTMSGFECYLADETELDIVTVDHYFSNREGRYTDFVAVCSRIRREIRTDQITGGMVGQYNASITQRLNALKEQSEVTVTEQPLFADPDEDNEE